MKIETAEQYEIYVYELANLFDYREPIDARIDLLSEAIAKYEEGNQ